MFGFFFGFGYGARNTHQSHYVDFLATTASRSQLSYSELLPLRRRKADITKPRRKRRFCDGHRLQDLVVGETLSAKIDGLRYLLPPSRQRNDVDLDQRAPRQPGHLNRGPRGRLVLEERSVLLIHRAEVVHVG